MRLSPQVLSSTLQEQDEDSARTALEQIIEIAEVHLAYDVHLACSAHLARSVHVARHVVALLGPLIEVRRVSAHTRARSLSPCVPALQ